MSYLSNRQRITRSCLVIAFMTVSLMVASCGKNPSNTPEIIVVAASATMNEPAPMLAPSDRALLLNAGATSDRGVVYIVDPNTGQPTETSLTPRRPDGQVEHGPRRSQLLAGKVNMVQRALDREAAAKPFDLLDLMAAAVRVTTGPATLIVVSSGLSTAGGFDLRKVGWGADPHAVAAQLKDRGLLPDLAGWHVVFTGLGDTAGRQPSLPLPERAVLAKYWLAICHAAAAASCSVDSSTRPDPPSHSTTPVPVVQVPQVESVHLKNGWTGESVSADEFFAFNSARLLPGADSILGLIAAKARAFHVKVSITGSASPDGGSNAYNQALSLARAQAVATRLIALGVHERQIIQVTGIGSADENRSTCYRRGRLDEAVCSRLRRVVILLSPVPAVTS